MSEDNVDQPTTKPIKISFSLPQILGGAGAAATAAAIGSQLGVAGTVAGAAIASVIGGVAGTLYSAGIARTHRTVSQAIQRATAVEESEEDLIAEEVATGEGMPESPTMIDTDLGLLSDSAETSPEPSPKPDRRKLVERMVLSGAAIFLVAVGIITTLELGLGRSLDGSSNTTIQRIAQDRTGTRSVVATPSAAPSAAPAVVPTTVAPTPSPTSSVNPTPATVQPTAAQDVPVLPTAPPT